MVNSLMAIVGGGSKTGTKRAMGPGSSIGSGFRRNKGGNTGLKDNTFTMPKKAPEARHPGTLSQTGTREVRPEAIIPLDDSDLEDF